jgi:hypothetical protein
METDTDANVFVAYSLKTVQTIFVQQADVRLIEDLDDVIIYTLKFHHFIKDSRS